MERARPLLATLPHVRPDRPFGWTRFVLPFGYHLTDCAVHQGAPVYDRCDLPNLAERRRYLTSETAMTLFDRATWFRLTRGDGRADWQRFPATFESGRRLAIEVDKPRVVLFEGESGKRDLLRTGFLCIDVSLLPEKDWPLLDDLLELNERFRFVWAPFEQHREKTHALLARYRHLSGGCLGDSPASARTTYFERWRELLDVPLAIGERTCRLFPDTWHIGAERWLMGQPQDDATREESWLVYADQRAFTWTQAGCEQGLASLVPDLEPEGVADWIRLLNVDPPGTTLRSTPFERAWATARTYCRWQHLGTVYGFCNHAGAQLAAPCDDPPIAQHFRDMYFDLALMLLYLRVTTFRFSQALSLGSAAARDHGINRLDAGLRDLREAFALFTNLYRFPLLSNQQQAIEMYEKLRQGLDIEELFEEVQEEIQSTEEYLSARRQETQNQVMTDLTFVAAIGLALSLTFGVYGMDARAFGIAPSRGLDAALVTLAFLLMFLVLLTVSRFVAARVHRLLSHRNVGSRLVPHVDSVAWLITTLFIGLPAYFVAWLWYPHWWPWLRAAAHAAWCLGRACS